MSRTFQEASKTTNNAAAGRKVSASKNQQRFFRIPFVKQVNVLTDPDHVLFLWNQINIKIASGRTVHNFSNKSSYDAYVKLLNKLKSKKLITINFGEIRIRTKKDKSAPQLCIFFCAKYMFKERRACCV